jgi:CubicO group peptidase (beta-lactamase class C family)
VSSALPAAGVTVTHKRTFSQHCLSLTLTTLLSLSGALTALCMTTLLAAPVMAAEDGRLQTMVKRLDAIRAQSGMASAYVLMVDRDNILLHQGLGIRAWDDPKPVTDSDYYRLGSISKAFTGLALLKAQQQGCLRLDDEVSQHSLAVPYVNPWQAHPITLAMLMEHTAGWYDMSWKEFKYNAPVSLEQAFQVNPLSRISQWPPGMHKSYSSSGPGVAAWALEQACNVDFEDFIAQQVFQPLHMPSATFQRSDEVKQHLVGGYNTDPHEPIRYWNFIYRPAGAMNVRPLEMANFLQMLINLGKLQGQQVFSEAQVRRMETPTTTLAARNGMAYGYGLGIYADIEDGHVIYAHGGDADGYLTRFAYNRESGRGFFVAITMFDHAPLGQMRELLESWLVEDLPAVSVPSYQPAVADLYALTGYYQPVTARFARDDWRDQRLRMRVSTGGLQYQVAPRRANSNGKNRWRTLYPVAKDQYRHANEPVATVWLGEHEGTIYLQTEDGNWQLVK